MNETQDFEALGRYVHAKERVSTLEMERHNLAGEMGRQLKDAVTGSQDFVRRFDHAKFVDATQRLQEINEHLEAAIAEANRHAEAAGKTKISIGRG